MKTQWDSTWHSLTSHNQLLCASWAEAAAKEATLVEGIIKLEALTHNRGRRFPRRSRRKLTALWTGRVTTKRESKRTWRSLRRRWYRKSETQRRRGIWAASLADLEKVPGKVMEPVTWRISAIIRVRKVVKRSRMIHSRGWKMVLLTRCTVTHIVLQAR